MAGFSATETVVVMEMWKRTSITAIQLIMTLITAGVIIGYGQLYPMLVDAGVYHNKCPADDMPSGSSNNNNNTTNSSDSGSGSGSVCPDQGLALNQLFNVGASVSIFIQAPSGIILDFLGPRITCWVGLALFIPGCFLFAFAPNIHIIDAYMIGFQLLAAGGPFVFISSLPVAQLWPDKKAMILMMINGVYGGGAFVFFLFALLYYHANITMKELFIGYGVIGCCIVVIAGFVWPKRSYSESKKVSTIQDPDTQLSVFEILSKSTQDITTVRYFYLALLISFLVFKSNYFLSTYPQQFGVVLHGSELKQYTDTFGVILPAIGILAGPIGLIFDKFGVNTALLIVIALSSVSSICGIIIHQQTFGILQIIRMLVFSTYYPMIYGVWAFFIIANFGSANFGVLYGVIAIMAGVVNISASNPLGEFAMDRTPPSFVEANYILAAVGGHGSGYYEPIA